MTHQPALVRSGQWKMMAKLVWRPFTSDEQRVEAAGMEGGRDVGVKE